jgi:dTMP kinase
MSKGRFVTFEGIDGCGKSTVTARVLRRLEKEGRRCVLTVEPTGTWLGKAVRKGWAEKVGPWTEAFLFMADRVEHNDQIQKWIAEGKLVLSDRYMDSTLAYQGAELAGRFPGGAAGAMKRLRDMHLNIAAIPHRTVYLRVTPELGISRLSGRAWLTKFEKLEFLRKVARNYDLLARREPKRIKVVDASRPLDEVVEKVLSMIGKIL